MKIKTIYNFIKLANYLKKIFKNSWSPYYKTYYGRNIRIFIISCGLYYKCLTIVIYDRNDIGLYYKTRDDRN